jgi:hypothetical protein
LQTSPHYYHAGVRKSIHKNNLALLRDKLIARTTG